MGVGFNCINMNLLFVCYNFINMEIQFNWPCQLRQWELRLFRHVGLEVMHNQAKMLMWGSHGLGGFQVGMNPELVFICVVTGTQFKSI